jgi:hypothetical protein
MTPTETAVLLRYGVTKPTIDALAAAGCDSLADILAIQREQIPLIPGVDEADARAVVRLVGLLADAGVGTAR